MSLHDSFILQSERLILREIVPKDARFFYDLNADPLVMKYTGDLPFESEDEARKFIANYSDYERHGFGRWVVVLKISGEIIGWCGLKRHPDQTVDLGFRFFQRHWNKGFATEAAAACLVYGFGKLEIKQIIGRVATENVASMRVLEKIGMRFWKTARVDGLDEVFVYKIDKN